MADYIDATRWGEEDPRSIYSQLSDPLCQDITRFIERSIQKLEGIFETEDSEDVVELGIAADQAESCGFDEAAWVLRREMIHRRKCQKKPDIRARVMDYVVWTRYSQEIMAHQCDIRYQDPQGRITTDGFVISRKQMFMMRSAEEAGRWLNREVEQCIERIHRARVQPGDNQDDPTGDFAQGGEVRG